MPTRPASPVFYSNYLNFFRIHGYKILVGIVITFIFIQFLSGLVTYHHRFTQNYASITAPSFSLRFKSSANYISKEPSSRTDNKQLPTNLLLKEENLEHKRELLAKSAALNNLTEDTGSGATEPIAENSSQKELCPLIPPRLVGRLKVLTDIPSFNEIEESLPQLEPGGRFRPKECQARHRVAIIIPYRDREEHLRIFLHNIHPMLMRQQIDYGIYIIEEIPNTKFNRAKLMNIGFVEALKQYDYQCFIFHDVDLIPEDDRNLYTCPDQPRHMSVAVDEMNYRLPYKDIFGGVSAVTKDQMVKVNGLSNEFWGWGGEDDDFSNRIRHYGYRINRYPADIARYKMIKHKKDTPNPERYQKLYKGRVRFKTDGLNSLKYERKDLVLKKLYTWVLVDLLQPSKK